MSDDSWQSTSLAVELFECCASDGLSEECIRGIIERHELTPHHNNTVSSYRFFRLACCNEKNTEGVIQILLEYFPDAVNYADDDGLLPLHYACNNDDMSLGAIQLLIDAAPDSVHRKVDGGNTLLHILCANSALEERKVFKMLKPLLEKCPESVRHQNNEGQLPIHVAAMTSKSTKNLSVLIEAYPGSERMTDHMGMLPIHYACIFGRVATVEYLYKLYPDAIVHATEEGMYLIHIAIGALRADVVKFLLGCNPNVKFQKHGGRSLLISACLVEYDSKIGDAVEMIEVIYDAHPEFIREEDSEGELPLHCLCLNKEFDGDEACEFLKLFLERYPESIHHANNRGHLPIHLASQVSKSPEFCRVLIEAYPGSERIADRMNTFPIHLACTGASVTTVEYLYNLYPDAIDHRTAIGLYPIHGAIATWMTKRNIADQEAAVDIVKFLLGCDPRVKLQKVSNGKLSLLAWVFYLNFNDDNIGSALEIIKAIYDVHPEEIESSEMSGLILRCHSRVLAFISSQLVYSRQARNSRLISTPGDNGQLPLHAALRNNVRLGSIKLLVKGYPPAVQSPDNSGALPLHIACAYHDSASVVQYLIELDESTLEAMDEENNTALHYACRGAKLETIALLLRKYDAVSVSKRNAQKKLPIDLLLESNEVVDRESIEYTGSIHQLVKAYPEIVMSWM